MDVKLEIDAIRAMEEEEEGKEKKNVMNRRNRFLSRRGRCLFSYILIFFFPIILNLYVTRFIVARSEI